MFWMGTWTEFNAVYTRTHARTIISLVSRQVRQKYLYPLYFDTLLCPQTMLSLAYDTEMCHLYVSLRIVSSTAPAFLPSALFLSLFVCVTKMSTADAVAE